MDNSLLKIWLNGVDLNHIRAKRANRFIFRSRFIYGFYAIILLILSTSYLNPGDSKTVVMLIILSMATIANICILFLISRSSITSNLHNTNRYLRLHKFGDNGMDINKDINLLKTSMELSADLEVYVDTKQFSLSPVVSKLKSNYLLILPIGFLTEYSKDKNSTKSILAHELAHIKQNDIELWSSYSRLVRKYLITFFLNVLIISLSLSIIQVEYSLGVLEKSGELHKFSMQKASIIARAEFNLISSIIISVFFPIAMIVRLRNYRKKSETLADLGAVVFTSKEEFLKSLKILKRSNSKKSYHLSVSDRVFFVEKLLKKNVSIELNAANNG